MKVNLAYRLRGGVDAGLTQVNAPYHSTLSVLKSRNSKSLTPENFEVRLILCPHRQHG